MVEKRRVTVRQTRLGRLPLMVALLLCLLLAAGCGRGGNEPAGSEPETPQPVEEEPEPEPRLPVPGPGEVINPLTALPMPETHRAHRVIAVSIGDNPGARPQAGLTQADLIYELPAEGGINRFLALFYGAIPEKIGPVRSARHYTLDLVMEWNAVLANVGGSPQYFADAARLPVPILDDVRGAGAFWRSQDRRAPNNTYTGRERLLERIEARGWNKDANPPQARWTFVPAGELPQPPAPAATAPAEGSGQGDPPGDNAPGGDHPGSAAAGEGGEFGDVARAQALVVSWRGSNETIRFAYDATNERYARSLDGTLQADEEGVPLEAANIIVQWVSAERIPGDDALRINLGTVGEGEILVVRGGIAERGRWRKPDRQSATEFTIDGRPLQLVPGRTWILLLTHGSELSLE